MRNKWMTNIKPVPQKYDFTVLQARKSKDRFRMKKQHAARFGIYLVGMVLLALGIDRLGVGRVIYFFNRAAKAKLLQWAGL